MTQATLHTSEGPIEVELFPEEAPKTVENFLLFEVPAEQAERVTGSVDGTDVRGHTLRLELANA